MRSLSRWRKCVSSGKQGTAVIRDYSERSRAAQRARERREELPDKERDPRLNDDVGRKSFSSFLSETSDPLKSCFCPIRPLRCSLGVCRRGGLFCCEGPTLSQRESDRPCACVCVRACGGVPQRVNKESSHPGGLWSEVILKHPTDSKQRLALTRIREKRSLL